MNTKHEIEMNFTPAASMRSQITSIVFPTTRVVVVAFIAISLLSESRLHSDEPISNPHKVSLKQMDGKWQLTRGGSPYYVKGAAGGGSLKLLAECGGNSTRIWGVGDNTKQRLDEAHRNGITVALGIWLEHERTGFDYSDPAQLSAQTAQVMDAVRKYKDHPAVLVWGIGNEMEGYKSGDNPAVWSHIEQLCQMVKKEDPDHPTMSVVAEIGGNRIEAIHEHCPTLDIIGINSYAGAATLPERYQNAGGTKPYIVAEFGPAGAWEVDRNTLNAVVEQSSNEKAKQYVETYQSLAQDRDRCLGSYAFLWGNKLEATATWFGLLLEDGRKTNAVDALTRLWTGREPANRCPEIASLKINGANEVNAGSKVQLSLLASDPDGSKIEVEWVLLPEADTYITNGDFQSALKPIQNIENSNSNSAEIKAPEDPGLYRVYAIVGDGHRAAAVANTPFRVRKTELSHPGKKVTIPFVIYDEADSSNSYSASGRIGSEASAIQDRNHTIEPKFGKTCISCSCSGKGLPAGIVWQHPASDSGDRPGGFDLSGAEKLTLWAKGSVGGEELIIGIGRIGKDKKYPDTKIKQKSILLTSHWKKFQIHIAHADLRRIKTGFFWQVEKSEKPVQFYLDRIIVE